MLLYFSAEGNTRYVALQLAKKLGEFPIFIQDVEAETLEWQGDTFGILFPVWSWGVPEIMLDFMQALPRPILQSHKGKEDSCLVGDDMRR